MKKIKINKLETKKTESLTIKTTKEIRNLIDKTSEELNITKATLTNLALETFFDNFELIDK